MNDRPTYPKSNLAILKRKTGDDGSYFVGSIGMAMITLTKLPEPDEDGNECWILKASNPPKKSKPDPSARQQSQAPSQRQAPASNSRQFDDEIPF